MKKRFCACVLIVTIIFSFTGCGLLAPLQAFVNYEQDQDIIYVAFYNEGEENKPIDYREIADYQSVYSVYNSRVMYNKLSPEEQQIYRLFEYAMDKEYTTMFFDSRILEGVERSLDDIMMLYAMDSPMLQQNYNYSVSETGYTFSYLGELLNFKITGEGFCIENFTPESTKKKKKAVEAAKKVFEKMPKGLNQLEQARFFFRYLTREVQYYDNKLDPGKQHNLYDAFVLKKTQCDGFANAFSLLCAMAKIPCVEKISSPKNKDEIGHTWNAFCADGVWYNADLALNNDIVELIEDMDIDYSFGFPDSRTREKADMPELFPACTADLLPVDFMVSSASDPKLVSGLRSGFKKGKRFIHVGLKKGKLTTADLQKIANRLQIDIRILDETVSGTNYYFIFKD